MTEPPTTPPSPDPTPSVPPSEATYAAPAGTALPIDVEAHPEALVGAAFAGGLLAGVLLRKLTGGRR